MSSPAGSRVPPLLTERLFLRQWRNEDRELFAAMNADAAVMEHFPSTLTDDESNAMVDRIQKRWADFGWGLWAVEIVEDRTFVGYVGLSPSDFDAHFTPAIEVGWRLATPYWGHGYATEAARAACAFGFDVVGLDEIVSWTATTNVRSQRVMQRLGMTRNPAEDFDHPRLPVGHRLRRHVLYRFPPRT